MKLTFDKRAKVVIVGLPKEVTSKNNDAVNLKYEFVRLNTEGFKNIIVDMKNTESIDSSGLSAILVLQRLCKDAGGNHALIHVSQSIQKLIRISQLEPVFNIKNNEAEALDLIMKVSSN